MLATLLGSTNKGEENKAW